MSDSTVKQYEQEMLRDEAIEQEHDRSVSDLIAEIKRINIKPSDDFYIQSLEESLLEDGKKYVRCDCCKKVYANDGFMKIIESAWRDDVVLCECCIDDYGLRDFVQG